MEGRVRIAARGRRLPRLHETNVTYTSCEDVYDVNQTGLMMRKSESEVRCSSCGRFLGYALISDGVIAILCKNCKGWTTIVKGHQGLELTAEQVRDMLENA